MLHEALPPPHKAPSDRPLALVAPARGKSINDEVSLQQCGSFMIVFGYSRVPRDDNPTAFHRQISDPYHVFNAFEKFLGGVSVVYVLNGVTVRFQ